VAQTPSQDSAAEIEMLKQQVKNAESKGFQEFRRFQREEWAKTQLEKKYDDARVRLQ
jgi:hypothetical protein